LPPGQEILIKDFYGGFYKYWLLLEEILILGQKYKTRNNNVERRNKK
jgi:hypothetical protein